jgi:hypothetical protein
MKILATLLLTLALAACSIMTRVEGDEVLNDKLVVHVTDTWNRLNDPWEGESYESWTQEGVPLDHLRISAGVQPGQALMNKPMFYSREADAREPRVPTFKTGLAAEKLVNLFEELYANEGVVTVTRMDPGEFADQPGVRFEFTIVRRADDLTLKGVGWLAVRHAPGRGEELYAATFTAPQQAFFDRLLPRAEAVVRTARIKG